MKQAADEIPFQDLTPELILDAIDGEGFNTTGSMMALNSFENRVYQVGVYDEYKEYDLVVKFYRPGRWTEDQILEEQHFSIELSKKEIPVVPPIKHRNKTLFERGDFLFSIFEKKGGRAPNLEDNAVLSWIGRLIGRVHAMGATSSYKHRPMMNVDEYLVKPSNYILDSDFVPSEIRDVYCHLVEQASAVITASLNSGPGIRNIRLMGDCHQGNILCRGDSLHFVDLDDSVMGPAIQDLWMLLSGDVESMRSQMTEILKGYEQFMTFDYGELTLVEPLRTLRIINYAGWLAQRWNDPAFKLAFPWFGTQRYWEQHIDHIREQLSAMQEPFAV